MKKTLLGSIAAMSLALIGVYVASFTTLNYSNNALTLTALIDKAQAAAEQQAEAGKYFHQKIKYTADTNQTGKVHEPPGNILITHSLPEDIVETWADTESENYMIANRNTDSDEAIYSIDITKNGTRKVFKLDDLSNPNAIETIDQPLAQTGRIPNIFFNFNRALGKGLESVLSGQEKIESLSSLFAPNLTVTNVTYLGQSTLNGKTVEGLSFETSDSDDPTMQAVINFYFDAQTFQLIEAHITQNGWISQVQYLTNEYSNDIPTVQIGNQTLALDNTPL